MNKKLAFAISLIVGFALVIGIALLSVEVACFDKNFYKNEYEKLSTAEKIGMSQDDLDEATDVLLDYLKDRRDDLSVEATIQGEVRQVFNQREIDHMVDVKNLYLGALNVCIVCLCAGVIGLVLVAFVFKRPLAAVRGYLWGNVLFLFVFMCLAFWAATDFYTFWTNFHLLFFTNDLWILDPSTDILIMMVPEQFFFDLVMRIVIYAVAALGVLAAAALVLRKHLLKKEIANG